MINQSIFDKILKYNFEELFKKKGYTYFTKGSYNLNIIGIRNANGKINDFDDAIIVVYKCKGKWRKNIFCCTTDPGKYYLNNPCCTDGCAILKEGQYKGAWKIGLHKGQYRALVQQKPVSVYRDNNKDNVFDFNPKTIQTGVFGINIHHAGVNSIQVDKWSAGCQVFNNLDEYNSFMRLCQCQIDYGHGNSFTYTLINEKDL